MVRLRTGALTVLGRAGLQALPREGERLRATTGSNLVCRLYGITIRTAL